MKVLSALIVAGLLGVLAAGCGGSKETTSSVSQAPTTTPGASTSTQPQSGSTSTQQTTPATPPSGSSTSSQQTGSPAETRRRYPHGDNSIQTYGHAAGEADKQAVAALVKRYYTAVAAGDGSTACSLLSSGIAKSITQGFGRAPALRNKGCAGILSLLFQHRAGRPTVDTSVEVTQVRLNGGHGFALLHSKTMPHGEITVYREQASWKIGALIGSSLP